MGKRSWTEADEELCKKLILEGKTYKEISKILNKTIGAISSKNNKKLKVDTSETCKYNIHYKAIYQDYNWCYQKFFIEGLNHDEMAKEANCTKRVIEKWCQEKHKLTQKYRQKNMTFNNLQKDLLIGSLLGDGHIDKRKTQPLFIVVHAENQKDYLYYKYEILKNLCNKEPSFIEGKEQYFSNKKYMRQNLYRVCTRIHDELIKYRKMELKELLDNLNEYSFSIWMLDDAYRTYSQWELCIAEMEHETEYIINIIKNKFNITPYITKDIRYLKFKANDSRKIDKIILENIPNDLDIIKYKITKNHISKERKYIHIKDNNLFLE